MSWNLKISHSNVFSLREEVLIIAKWLDLTNSLGRRVETSQDWIIQNLIPKPTSNHSPILLESSRILL